jgi:hypothetical protein
VGLFDWLKRGGRREPVAPVAWQVTRDANELTVDDGRGKRVVVQMGGARFVRVVPLTGGQVHGAGAQMPGWQVALSRAEGDMLVGAPMADWRNARELARLICERTELPLDETTERMFSRVGQFSPRT